VTPKSACYGGEKHSIFLSLALFYATIKSISSTSVQSSFVKLHENSCSPNNCFDRAILQRGQISGSCLIWVQPTKTVLTKKIHHKQNIYLSWKLKSSLKVISILVLQIAWWINPQCSIYKRNSGNCNQVSKILIWALICLKLLLDRSSIFEIVVCTILPPQNCKHGDLAVAEIAKKILISREHRLWL